MSQKKRKSKLQLRRFTKVKKTANYHETDFWEVNLERKPDKYDIPAQNKVSGDQASGRDGSRRSSYRTWSFKNIEKKTHGKAGTEVPSSDLPGISRSRFDA